MIVSMRTINIFLNQNIVPVIKMRYKMLFSLSVFHRIYRKLNDWALCGIFDDYARIKNIPQHLDIINLGSNPAKFGLDYSCCDIRGFNLAVGPQTLEYDFKMLKNYYSFLDENGPKLLLLLFCPFSLCKFRYTDCDGTVSKDLRYYPILHHAMINDYKESVYRDWRKHTLFRLLRHPRLVVSILRDPVRRKLNCLENPLDAKQMEVSATNYICGWMREFGLQSFNVEEIPLPVKEDLRKNSEILEEIIAFCAEHGINPIIVLPPVSRSIMSNIPHEFRDFCTYTILKSKNIQLLDYTDNQEYNEPGNFVDALCLNKRGRYKFTQRVISDLRQLKLLK